MLAGLVLGVRLRPQADTDGPEVAGLGRGPGPAFIVRGAMAPVRSPADRAAPARPQVPDQGAIAWGPRTGVPRPGGSSLRPEGLAAPPDTCRPPKQGGDKQDHENQHQRRRDDE